MRKWYNTVFLYAILVLFFVVSCKSTPKEAETETVPPAASVSQASLDALDQAAARAEQARKRALDFSAGSYFPSDWEAVEAKYTSAGNQSRATEDEVQQTAALYNEAAVTYDDLFKKAVPLFAKDREDEIVAARNEVITTGFGGAYLEYVRKADQSAVQALAQYDAEDYYAAKDTAAVTLAMYQTLKTGADAYSARQEIVRRGFVAFDSENFARAEEIAVAAINNYENGNISQAQNEAEEAGLRYNLVLKAGWRSFASERADVAAADRQKALDLKANIAVRDDFNAAQDVYNRAQAAFRSEKYDDATIFYTNAAARFAAVSETAAEKRRIAEEAIKEAEEKISESDENARQAEIIIEGGDQ
ncbi:MAG: hypothetical protein LBN21_07320 [Treponema sp.]|jgi:hypothetical protein|nr:hypothetical protein [Treponema sp.]